MDTLRDILADPSDFNVCDGLFMLIAKRYGGQLDITTATEYERTVLLVWHAYGIIGNGGFHYLLEGNFKGDPGFRHTASAFRTIGCESAAKAFDRVLALFPKGQLPSDIDRRLNRYRKHFSGFPNAVDGPFFAASKEIENCLAEYIRSNARRFSHLE